jgi:hypothetical protein
MEASEVGTKAGIGGFLSKVLGAGVKETSRFHRKRNRQNRQVG